MERLRGAEEWDKRAEMLAAQGMRSKPGIFHYFYGGTLRRPEGEQRRERLAVLRASLTQALLVHDRADAARGGQVK